MKTLPLSRGQEAVVDDEDYDDLAQFKWSVIKGNSGFYAVRGVYLTKTKHTTEAMARRIMKPGDGQQVDHINHNELDNRRCNLRLCTPSQNGKSKNKHRKSRYRFKGIWINEQGKWRAGIMSGGKRFSLGTYERDVDAARAYDRAARKYHGEFAATNFPEGEQS